MDNYSQRAGDNLAKEAPVTAQALRALLGLEVQSVIDNPTAVKEIINGGGNLAGASANRTRIIVKSAEFQGKQAALQAEKNRLAQQLEGLTELQGFTSQKQAVVDKGLAKAFQKAEVEGLQKKSIDTTDAALKKTTDNQTTKAATNERNDYIMKAPATAVAESFNREIDQLNYGNAKAIVKRLIQDANQLPEGAFKNEALEILNRDDIETRFMDNQFMSSNATPQQIESLGNSLIDVLVRYEDSLKMPTSSAFQNLEIANGVEAPSLSLSTKLEVLLQGLQGDNPTVQSTTARLLIDEVEQLIKNNDPFLANYRDGSVQEALEATRKAIQDQNSKEIFNAAGGLLEIAQQAQKSEIETKLAPLEQLFQEAISEGSTFKIQSLNTQIQALKAQL